MKRSTTGSRQTKAKAPALDMDYLHERALIILGAVEPSGRYADLVELNKSLAPLPANAKEWQHREPRAAVQGKDGTP